MNLYKPELIIGGLRYMFSLLLFFTDIDECLSSPCNALASYSCNNTNGSYECACKKGYEFDGVSCVGM